MQADNHDVCGCRNMTHTWHRCTYRLSWSRLSQSSSRMLTHQVVCQLVLACMQHTSFSQDHHCVQQMLCHVMSDMAVGLAVSIEHALAVGLCTVLAWGPAALPLWHHPDIHHPPCPVVMQGKRQRTWTLLLLLLLLHSPMPMPN